MNEKILSILTNTLKSNVYDSFYFNFPKRACGSHILLFVIFIAVLYKLDSEIKSTGNKSRSKICIGGSLVNAYFIKCYQNIATSHTPINRKVQTSGKQKLVSLKFYYPLIKLIVNHELTALVAFDYLVKLSANIYLQRKPCLISNLTFFSIIHLPVL